MATFITRTQDRRALEGSAEKRVDYAPDGTMWLLLVDGRAGRMFRSRNGGTSWSYSSGSDISLGMWNPLPGMFIDADGYAHVAWARYNADPQSIRYARGRPTSGGGWRWSYKDIYPASGRVGADADVVAFRSGSGWVAWVDYDIGSLGAAVAQVNISSTGYLHVGATFHGPSNGREGDQLGVLEFAHTGDGKTPGASPHVFLGSARQYTTGKVRFHRARHESGKWTWESAVEVDTAAAQELTAMAAVYDGARFCMAWCQGGSSSVVRFADWTGTGSATRRDPPALPGGLGAIDGLSLAHDPVTDNLYLVVTDGTDGDIRWVTFTRATDSWGSWGIATSRPPNTGDDNGKVQLVRHPPADAVDMVYAYPRGGETYDIYYQRLLGLVRAPGAPTLLSPASGARLNLAAGGTFTWRYSPVGAGDSQSAWAMRRTFSSTTEHWNNASQSWGASEVWNTGPESEATFAAGKWSSGTTYSWSVRTRSATGADSPWSTSRTVVATQAPVVEVLEPSGLFYGSSTPAVEWAYTSLESQRDYEVRIVESTGVIDPNDPGPAVWSSGVVASSIARSALVAEALDDGVGYRAYVRATSSSGTPSVWVYSDFVLSLSPPAGPLVEVMDELDYDTDVVRVRLNLWARSNFLSAGQALGQEKWNPWLNATLAAQEADPGAQLETGLSLTSQASGLVSAVSADGEPPAAPIGEPQPLGPLDFPVVAGQAYTAVASFKAAGTTRAARLRLEWLSVDDGTTVPGVVTETVEATTGGTSGVISSSIGEQVVTGTTDYAPASVTAIAPVGALRVRVYLEVLGATAADEVFHVTRMSLHPGRDLSWQSGGYAQTQTVRVQRSTDDGTTWATILERVRTDVYQRAVARDRLMPMGTEVRYRAFTDVDTGGGSSLASAASPTALIVVETSAWAVRDPADEHAEVTAYVTGLDESDEEAASVHRPSGRLWPVVDTEGAQSGEGRMTLYVPPVLWERTADVLRRPVPLVLQSPAGRVLWVRMLRRDVEPVDILARQMQADFVEIEPV